MPGGFNEKLYENKSVIFYRFLFPAAIPADTQRCLNVERWNEVVCRLGNKSKKLLLSY